MEQPPGRAHVCSVERVWVELAVSMRLVSSLRSPPPNVPPPRRVKRRRAAYAASTRARTQLSTGGRAGNRGARTRRDEMRYRRCTEPQESAGDIDGASMLGLDLAEKSVFPPQLHKAAGSPVPSPGSTCDLLVGDGRSPQTAATSETARAGTHPPGKKVPHDRGRSSVDG